MYTVRVTRTLTYEVCEGTSAEQARTFAIADTDPGAFEQTSCEVHRDSVGSWTVSHNGRIVESHWERQRALLNARAYVERQERSRLLRTQLTEALETRDAETTDA